MSEKIVLMLCWCELLFLKRFVIKGQKMSEYFFQHKIRFFLIVLKMLVMLAKKEVFLYVDKPKSSGSNDISKDCIADFFAGNNCSYFKSAEIFYTSP